VPAKIRGVPHESLIDEVTDELSDDELAAIALGADPDVGVADDATSLWDLMGPVGPGVLPEWYMPSPMGGRACSRSHPRWHRRVALLVILSFLVIEACGLCITYGQLVLA